MSIKCPSCKTEILSPRDMDQLAGMDIDHKLNGSVIFADEAEYTELKQKLRDARESLKTVNHDRETLRTDFKLRTQLFKVFLESILTENERVKEGDNLRWKGIVDSARALKKEIEW